ncbi:MULTISPECIES: hypothetical protein [unclassified Rhodanobacter]|uniref:hypothetical protein n=1 Tax=unclassified Rhodanobacter TaxID=2621553 RepID=UPI001BE09B8F|nr:MULTISPECIES: hypothetical protein [unclassified Rhodanobacter]MBT2145280.1 hypothetical protein [Rhodanobacter sp. LX-99]MBT2149325.1 hypothetical protein [Rhodanobacter sp. LX-100]
MKRIFAAALAVMVLAGAHAQTAKRAATPKELAAIKDSLQSTLKDADSLKFKDVDVSLDSKGTLCGLLNAKNSYGAYVGYVYFFGAVFTEHLKEPVAMVLSIDDGDTNIAEQMCKKYGMI